MLPDRLRAPEVRRVLPSRGKGTGMGNLVAKLWRDFTLMKLRRCSMLAAVMAAGLFQTTMMAWLLGSGSARADNGPVISVDDSSNGSTVQAVPGQAIEVTLHSTYWKVDGSSAASVVAQDSEPSVRPAPPGTCLPGMGCGNVQVTFTARQVGTARISASRRLCGEDLLCRPDQQSFVVTVTVR